MNNPESIQIINRFYEALNMIIAQKKIRGVQTFTREYGINRRNFCYVAKNPTSDVFQMSWIMHLVKDFGISAEWIMTGNGAMFR